MVISDSHKSIRKAVAEVYPEAAWQRCQAHFQRNILDITPHKYKEALALDLRRMFDAESTDDARQVKEAIVTEYGDVAEKAMEVLETGFEESMTAKCLPLYLQTKLRTTNILERLNRELKRRSDVIQVFPNPESVLRLMGAVTIEINNGYTVGNSIYAEKAFNKLNTDAFPHLRRIALEQLALIKAA